MCPERQKWTNSTVASLVIADDVEVRREAADDNVPHRQVGEDRVDQDEPRLGVGMLDHAHMELDAVLDRHVDLLQLRAGERHRHVAVVRDVQRDEQARDHVVRGGRGGRLDDQLVDLGFVADTLGQLRLERAKDVVGHADVARHGVGILERRGLERRERSGRGRAGQRAAEVAGDGELGRRETFAAADLFVRDPFVDGLVACGDAEHLLSGELVVGSSFSES